MVSLNDFKEFWEGEIAKIEKEPLDSGGARRILLRFRFAKDYFLLSLREDKITSDVIVELTNLEAKIVRALETARSRYHLKSLKCLRSSIFNALKEIISKVVEVIAGRQNS